MKLFNYLLTILFCMAVWACNDHREYRNLLSRAEAEMYRNPDSALVILDSLGMHQSELTGNMQMQYLLQLTTARTKMGEPFTTDSLTKSLVDYFEDNGSDEEVALAYYLYGCSLIDLGQAPEGLKAYYTALDYVDTTKIDCNYNLLKCIYGQMSLIFDDQNLPQDEIWALNHYVENVRKTSSHNDYLFAKYRLVSPYVLLNEIDSVISICEETHQALKRIGDNQGSARVLAPLVYLYMERGQMEKAAWAKEIFEKESGWFGKNGNIENGRESYYYAKGLYELTTNQLDSAEMTFRKSIQSGCLSDGYKGLLAVYNRRNKADSVYRYALLYEAAQDTLRNQMRTDAIHQMSALYNYNKSKEEAEMEREKSRRLKMYITFFSVVFILSAGFVVRFYQKYQKKKKLEILELNRKLEKSLNTRTEILMELRLLKSKDYESVIAAKEAREAELTETIRQLQEQKGGSNDNLKDDIDAFKDSKIGQLFIRKSNKQTERCQANEAEWNLLTRQFCQDLPMMYKSFTNHSPLSPLELRVCILYILGVSEKNFYILLGNAPSVLTNAKTRANQKLFEKKDARSLKNNLLQSINRA